MNNKNDKINLATVLYFLLAICSVVATFLGKYCISFSIGSCVVILGFVHKIVHNKKDRENKGGK